MNNLLQVNYELGVAMGRWMEMGRAREEAEHSCEKQHFRYPWPPDKNCPGCRATVSKYVRIFHLELPYLLLGWDITVAEISRMFDYKVEQAAARRDVGAHI